MAAEIVPINSLSRHIAPMQESLAQAASRVIKSGYYVLGPCVSQFEQEFAQYCGVAECVTVANGTDALELSLRAAGVGPGDRVAVVANAAMYGTSAVLACGASPVFIDVLMNEATMDPALLEVALKDNTIKAVIITHLYGRLARIEAIASICKSKGAILIEDCAQAHGARDSRGRKAGSFGTLASFSFYPTKNLGALGDGGAVVSDNPEVIDRVRKLRQYGWTHKYTNSLAGGRNSRLDEIQACMLSHMLPQLDEWNFRRRAIANRYSKEMIGAKISKPAVCGDDYVGHLYVVHCEERDQLQAHLKGQGIQTDVHYPVPDHHQPCHSGQFNDVELPVTEYQARTALTLPCFPELMEDEIRRVIDACNRF